jgi:hypothetical protein
MTRHTSFVLAGALAVLAPPAAALSAAPPPEPPTTCAIPPSPGDGWTTGAPEHLGMNRRRLEQMTDSIRSHPGLRGVLLQQGRTSVPKSVVSALVGVASAAGAIPSLDASLLDFHEHKDLPRSTSKSAGGNWDPACWRSCRAAFGTRRAIARTSLFI